MNISVSDLRCLFDKILSKLESEGVSNVPVDVDNYWVITADVWDNFNEDVKPVVGSLEDDWESLQKVKNNENPCTYVDFDRLASILRVISQQRNPI